MAVDVIQFKTLNLGFEIIPAQHVFYFKNLKYLPGCVIEKYA